MLLKWMVVVWLALLGTVVLLDAVTADGQTAQVLVVSDADAANLVKLYGHLEAARKAYEEAADAARKKYALVGEKDPARGSEATEDCPAVLSPTERCTERYYRAGFGEGVEFTADFKYLVPAGSRPTAPVCSTGGSAILGRGINTTPWPVFGGIWSNTSNRLTSDGLTTNGPTTRGFGER